MTNPEMIIIVPTRGRPDNVSKVIQAWEDTGAAEDGAELEFAIDGDDPAREEYEEAIHVAPGWVKRAMLSEWRPMVYKLNFVANPTSWAPAAPFALGFAGDDHLPRTAGWAGRYLRALREMGTGVVSCPDGYRTDQLPTQWAMTTDIVRALGRMVPAPVDHLFCDNAVWELAKGAGRYHYLKGDLIEHMHPLAGKGGWDPQYKRVNARAQWRDDQAAYEKWLADPAGLGADVMKVRALLAS